MRNKFTRKLAIALAVLLSVNCITPALAEIDTIEDFYIRDEDEDIATPDNTSTSSNASASNMPKGVVEITDIGQLEGIFPDEILREYVFEAVRDGQDGCSGATIEDALANFHGDIKAVNKGIKKIDGLQFLRKANILNLQKNEITDFTPLVTSKNPSSTYYGYKPGELTPDERDEREEGNNVFFDFNGNPFGLLPTAFGGRLVIKQPGTSSYTYDDLVEVLTVVRMDTETFTESLNIMRCMIDETPARPIQILSVDPNGSPNLLKVDWKSGEVDSDTTARLTSIVGSGIQKIAVGTEQEIHYDTADEFDTMTPGSQSLKYYIKGLIKIYDSIELTNEPYKSAFELTKVDSATNTPIAGVKYDLFKKDGSPVGQGTTDADGKITFNDLESGDYYFVETEAPAGFITDSTPQHFQITAPHETTIAGGVTSVTTTGGQTVEIPADKTDYMRYIAGPHNATDGIDSPDIELKHTKETTDPDVTVTVTYSSLGSTPDAPGTGATRVFNSIEQAQDDINKEKNTNNITGKVTVHVKYDGTAANAVTKLTVTNQNYNSVEVTTDPYKGAIVLKKVDSKTSDPLSGAKYDLFRSDGTLIDHYTSGADGKITVENLEPGDYYFEEAVAPSGYIKDPTKKPFTIKAHSAAIDGGLTEVKATNGSVITSVPADKIDRMRYIAGPDKPADGISSPDISLSSTPAEGTAKITVTYASLSTGETSLEKTFDTVAAAQDDINTRKNSNEITGDVRIQVKYENGTADTAETIPATNDPEDPTPPGPNPPGPEPEPDPETTTLEGRKTWINNGYTGEHPDLRIILYRDGKELKSQILHNGQAEYRFSGLPIKDPQGNTYVYTVSEAIVDPTEAAKFENQQVDFDFINTYVGDIGETTTVEGTKSWDDSAYKGTQTLVHPDVTIILYQNGKRYGSSYVIKSGDSRYRFTNLPAKDTDGNDYVYTVKEQPVSNYTPTISENGDILNTYKPNPPSPNHGGGGGGGNPPDTPYTPGGPGDPPAPGPGEVPPTDPFIPGEPGEPQEPGVPEVHEEPGGPSGLPKTGQERSIALWTMLSSLGLAIGATTMNTRKSKRQDS